MLSLTAEISSARRSLNLCRCPSALNQRQRFERSGCVDLCIFQWGSYAAENQLHVKINGDTGEQCRRNSCPPDFPGNSQLMQQRDFPMIVSGGVSTTYAGTYTARAAHMHLASNTIKLEAAPA